jgi:hypothetical protein
MIEIDIRVLYIRPLVVAAPPLWPLQPALALPRHNPYSVKGFIRAMLVLGFLVLVLIH